MGRSGAEFVDVLRVEHSPNRAPSTSVDMFELDPLHLARVDRAARDVGLSVVGVWHSHPLAPAVPSARDRAAATPGWCYAIVSLASHRTSIRCWRLVGSGFVEDDVSV